jgi:L-fuculose-phosphate aldolase
MLLEAQRHQVVDAARELLALGLVIGTAGNVSMRLEDVVLITPSGIDYRSLTAAQVCVVDVDGHVREAALPPSTELPLHLAAYRTERPAADQVAAVVHTHSTYATAAGLVVDTLPAVHYLIAMLGGPVPVVPYSTPGSDALAEAIAAALPDRSALLLRNHGVVTVGPTLRVALEKASLVEWLAEVYAKARVMGTPAVVDDEELARVAHLLAHYGSYSSTPPGIEG